MRCVCVCVHVYEKEACRGKHTQVKTHHYHHQQGPRKTVLAPENFSQQYQPPMDPQIPQASSTQELPHS